MQLNFKHKFQQSTKIYFQIQKQLDEFDRLVAQSNNKVMATMELATNIDDMVLDGIL